jgi:hypothetical protein
MIVVQHLKDVVKEKEYGLKKMQEQRGDILLELQVLNENIANREKALIEIYRAIEKLESA